jgi:hypothetical protein
MRRVALAGERAAEGGGVAAAAGEPVAAGLEGAGELVRGVGAGQRHVDGLARRALAAELGGDSGTRQALPLAQPFRLLGGELRIVEIAEARESFEGRVDLVRFVPLLDQLAPQLGAEVRAAGEQARRAIEGRGRRRCVARAVAAAALCGGQLFGP